MPDDEVRYRGTLVILFEATSGDYIQTATAAIAEKITETFENRCVSANTEVNSIEIVEMAIIRVPSRRARARTSDPTGDLPRAPGGDRF
jgi:hypothetical protein